MKTSKHPSITLTDYTIMERGSENTDVSRISKITENSKTTSWEVDYHTIQFKEEIGRGGFDFVVAS